MGYHIQSWKKPANARHKRAHRGLEKYWNKFGEPFIKFLGGYYTFNIQDKWIKHKRRNDKTIKDYYENSN